MSHTTNKTRHPNRKTTARSIRHPFPKNPTQQKPDKTPRFPILSNKSIAACMRKSLRRTAELSFDTSCANVRKFDYENYNYSADRSRSVFSADTMAKKGHFAKSETSTFCASIKTGGFPGIGEGCSAIIIAGCRFFDVCFRGSVRVFAKFNLPRVRNKCCRLPFRF